eukprot:5657752-Alexandrium_andersonii.AAC.1
MPACLAFASGGAAAPVTARRVDRLRAALRACDPPRWALHSCARTPWVELPWQSARLSHVSPQGRSVRRGGGHP